MIDDLDPPALERRLVQRGASIGLPLAVAAVTASTNEDARRAARRGAPTGAAFVADMQTAGRGRLRRSWHSPPGENLYVSFVLRPAVSRDEVATLGLIAGLSVADVVAMALGRGRRPGRVAVKWPNDVLLDGRKVAGILVEAETSGEAVRFVVAGIGLNVRTRSFPAELSEIAGSLALADAPVLDRGALLVSLAAAFGERLERLERGGLPAMMAELSALDSLAGREVWVGSERWVARGISPEGRLRLEGADGVIVERSSGEVSLGAGSSGPAPAGNGPSGPDPAPSGGR